MLQEKREAEKRLEELQEERERRQLDGCTFHPQLFARAASQEECVRRGSLQEEAEEEGDTPAEKASERKRNYSVQDNEIIFD